MIERLPQETAFQYHKRLVEGKLVDKTLSDYDYAELSPFVYGQEYSADVARRMMYGSAKTIQLLESEPAGRTTDTALIDELELKKIELQKERQRFFDQRTEYNRMLREQAREDELRDILERTIAAGNLPVLEYEPFEPFTGDSSLLVFVNDLHYGASYKNHWGEYNSDICKCMLRNYLNEIVNIANTHCAQDCYVICNGDNVAGNIHLSIRLTNKENIIEQVTGVAELLSEFVAELSAYFSNVYFTSVAGNHSRLDTKDDALLSERLDDIVEWYMKARLQNFENVEVGYGDRIDPTMFLIGVRGKKMLGVHGDFDPSIANVTNLQAMVGEPLHAVLLGHRHYNMTTNVQGIKIIQSGSFLGTDDYCITKRLHGKPSQIVSVVTDDGIVCNYDVELSTS